MYLNSRNMVAERNLDPWSFCISREPLPLSPQSLSSPFAQGLFPEPWEVVLPLLAFAKFSMVGAFTGLIEDSTILTKVYNGNAFRPRTRPP